MKTRNFIDALDGLDAVPADTELKFEQIGDQATEVDADAEIAAFVNRPAIVAEAEAPQRIKRTSKTYSGGDGTGRSAWAEAAGL
jgi:hypothetical protein